MQKIEIEVLNKLPTQVGTKFSIVYEDSGYLYTVVCRVSTSGKYIDEDSSVYTKEVLLDTGGTIIALHHAELMALYEQTGSDYSKWEFLSKQDVWTPVPGIPLWSAEIKYRYTGSMLQINGSKVPRPIRDALPLGAKYYAVDLLDVNATQSVWLGTIADHTWLKRGLIHLEEQDALAHMQAIIDANTKEE